jgi:uncharacterized protein YlaI
MKKKYLIDVENVHESFVGQISPKNGDEIYLFCTEHVPRFNHTKLAEIKKGWIRFVEVKGGKQSLDMHISTFLGYIIDDKKEFVIVSNDTDYDGIIDFWNRNGYNVRRQEIQKTEEDSNGTTGNAKLELNNRIMKLFAGQDCASKIASITIKNYAQGHDAVYKEIVKHYGQERGLSMYNKVKNVI